MNEVKLSEGENAKSFSQSLMDFAIELENAVSEKNHKLTDLQMIYSKETEDITFVRDNYSNCDVGREEVGPVLKRGQKKYFV